MFNFMCEYTGSSDSMIIAGKLLRKGIATIVQGVSREDLNNLIKGQENGWVKIHGAISFSYGDVDEAIDIYKRSNDSKERKMILDCIGKLVAEHQNDFVKNNDLEFFFYREMAGKKDSVQPAPAVEPALIAEESPVVESALIAEESPVVESAPVVEEDHIEEPAAKKTRKTAKPKSN